MATQRKGSALTSVQFVFDTKFVRRFPDPVISGAERVVMFVPAASVPEGIPLDANPRDQNINKRVYKKVLTSLLEEDDSLEGTFHLKNKGITLLASSVTKTRTDQDRYNVRIDDGQGIVDGGHTYRIVLHAQESGTLPLDQFVKFEILVGLPESLITDIADGLNTAVQVQEMSLANLGGEFDWIKARLAGEPYESVIGYRENEAEKELDVRDVIAYMALFNIELWPNDGSEYPINAYRAKVTVLQQFLQNADSFKKLTKILPDILELVDIVGSEARDLHNRAGGKAGRLHFMKERHVTYPFIGAEGDRKMDNGALFPMVGAFRWMVEEDDDGNFRWKGGSFARVKKIWRASGAELMKATQATNQEIGYNSNALGKSRNHWATLHSIVLKHDLTAAPHKK